MSTSSRTFVGLAVSLVVASTASCSRDEFQSTPTGLRYKVLAAGNGPVAAPGQLVSIHETTTLPNGAVIFDSRSRGTPIDFTLGARQVIDGVDEGVTGMRVGERRLLVIPPALSRRTSYPDNTPKDSTLHIDLELVAILKDK